jgi:hypothetical protein
MKVIDIVGDYVTETILDELIKVDKPANVSREIGAIDTPVSASMNDMLPHRGIRERNKPQEYSEIFAKAMGDSHNDGFEREPAPSPKKIKLRRNNNAGIDKLTSVSKKGDASALLHQDHAGKRPVTKPILP